ncbi:hypothetical protein C8Q77DRAFT_1073702 [Trametes polyzona]|nr:hypothetical protein C8Q77DRAFT_1073702 [Trametes polyzona]
MTSITAVMGRAATDSELSSARATIISCISALFIESILYGVFAVACGVGAWILLYKRSAPELFSRNVVLFVAITLMFSLATTHLGLDVYIAIKSFLSTGSDLTTASNMYETLNDWPTNPIGATKFAFYVTQTLIGDGFMIYRAYVVWDRMWQITIVPLALLLVEVVLGYVTASLGRLGASDAIASTCVDAWCILSVILNFFCSGLIMRRILWPAKGHVRAASTGSQAKSVRRRVVESVIQSAAIYSVASISFGITSFLSPNIGFPLCHSLFPPVIGIVFLLIVIRINRNASAGETSSDGLRYLQDVGERQSHYSVRPVATLTSVYESPRRSSFGSRYQEFVPGPDGTLEKSAGLSV